MSALTDKNNKATIGGSNTEGGDGRKFGRKKFSKDRNRKSGNANRKRQGGGDERNNRRSKKPKFSR